MVARRTATSGIGPSDADLHRVGQEEIGTLDLRQGSGWCRTQRRKGEEGGQWLGLDSKEVRGLIPRNIKGVMWGIWPPVSIRQDMGRTIRDDPAHKIKTCTALVDVHRKILYSTK